MNLSDLANAKHPYYCSESNYYSNMPNERYETMSEFLDDFESYDVDLNLCFRWDVREIMNDDDASGTGKYSAEVFLILQRKGIFKPCTIKSIEENDVDRFVAYLRSHADTLVNIWNPII